MIILAVDDEKLGLAALTDSIRQAAPEAEVYSFRDAEEAMELVKKVPVDAAFLDIHLRGTLGTALARSIKVIRPQANIIFATGFSDYRGDAFNMHASGYIMKPVTVAKVKAELDNLRIPVANNAGGAQPEGGGYSGASSSNGDVNSGTGSGNFKTGAEKNGNDALFRSVSGLIVNAFGSFEVFYEGVPLKFRYDKTKELFAYLIDRRGALCTNGEILANLWEDDNGHDSYLRGMKKDLHDVLKGCGAGDVLVSQRAKIGVIVDRIHCDYYEFLKGNPAAINAYRGEYMSQYSWAELTNASLG